MISKRISDDIPPRYENFEYGYPHSNALLQFRLKLELCKPHKAAHQPTICDIINDVKLFQTVANFLCYPIICRFTKASALEWAIDIFVTFCTSN